MSGDNAIKSKGDDRLGRSGFADQLAGALLSEAADEGLVAALVGPWGQGKSSVLNMVKEQLEGDHARTVLMFNRGCSQGNPSSSVRSSSRSLASCG